MKLLKLFTQIILSIIGLITSFYILIIVAISIPTVLYSYRALESIVFTIGFLLVGLIAFKLEKPWIYIVVSTFLTWLTTKDVSKLFFTAIGCLTAKPLAKQVSTLEISPEKQVKNSKLLISIAASALLGATSSIALNQKLIVGVISYVLILLISAFTIDLAIKAFYDTSRFKTLTWNLTPSLIPLAVNALIRRKIVLNPLTSTLTSSLIPTLTLVLTSIILASLASKKTYKLDVLSTALTGVIFATSILIANSITYFIFD